jgi:hypothetical protein
MVADQPVERLGGQQVGEAVLDRDDLERGRVALGQGDRAERGTGVAALDELAVPVPDIGRARPQDVEMVVVRPARDERRAPAEVLDAYLPEQPPELGLRQLIERRMRSQERAYLHQFGCPSHDHILTARVLTRLAPVAEVHLLQSPTNAADQPDYAEVVRPAPPCDSTRPCSAAVSASRRTSADRSVAAAASRGPNPGGCDTARRLTASSTTRSRYRPRGHGGGR